MLVLYKESQLINKKEQSTNKKDEHQFQQKLQRLKMIDLKISNNKESQLIYKSMNIQFYKELLGWIRLPEENTLYTQLSKKQKKLQKLLVQLSQQEQLQWGQHIFLKVKQLSASPTNRTNDELVQKLYLLSRCASKFNLPVCHRDLHQIIKQTYYEIYKDKIIPVFRKSKFNVQQFQVFEYQDPWYTRLWRTIVQ